MEVNAGAGLVGFLGVVLAPRKASDNRMMCPTRGFLHPILCKQSIILQNFWDRLLSLNYDIVWVR